MTRSPLLVSLAVASAFACSKPSEAPKPADGKAAPTAAPQVKDDGTGPAAIVNGIEVSRELFKREFDQTMDRYKKARHEVRPGLKERLKDNIVRRLVDMEVIRQQAEKMKVALTDEEKNLRWTEHRKRYGTDEAFKAFLERAGTTEEDIRRQFNANLLREKVFSKVASTVEVADDDIRKFYDDNVSRYTEPEQVKARHILLRKPNNATPEQIKEVKAKAATVLKKVKRKGADFAALAKKYSEDVTKNRGGELGWFAKGRMVKAFETAAWQLKTGATSDLVETNFGFHIIKRDDFKASRTKPFKEVKPLIKRSLTARRRNQAIQQSIKTWRDEAKIDVRIKGDPEIIKQDAPKPRTKPASLPVKKGAPVGKPSDNTGPPKQ